MLITPIQPGLTLINDSIRACRMIRSSLELKPGTLPHGRFRGCDSFVGYPQGPMVATRDNRKDGEQRLINAKGKMVSRAGDICGARVCKAS